MSTQAKDNKPRLRPARSAFAVFRDEDGFGTAPVQFWQERKDGSWAGLVAHGNGLQDAATFPNFVRFDSRQKRL